MSTVQEIKLAIAKLTLEERAEVAAELCGWGDDAWDRQMKADAAAGKFDALNRDADAAHATGQTGPLGEILREP
jgi:hypothetical protein